MSDKSQLNEDHILEGASDNLNIQPIIKALWDKSNNFNGVTSHLSIPQDGSYDLVVEFENVRNIPSHRAYYRHVVSDIARETRVTSEEISNLNNLNLIFGFKLRNADSTVEQEES
jgi:hypothetical protein